MDFRKHTALGIPSETPSKFPGDKTTCNIPALSETREFQCPLFSILIYSIAGAKRTEARRTATKKCRLGPSHLVLKGSLMLYNFNEIYFKTISQRKLKNAIQ
jgi:hypothetical protein